ncbi:odorant receptor 94b-like [Cydia amplana]|uniref:odorant receptor 94b-like n=1 Tax=Cydia amplana TaxID=1869771 RepID=UPI002FE6318E
MFKQIFSNLLSRYIPVWNHENPVLANTVLRLIRNTGIWHYQSLGLHWVAKFAIICFISTNLTQVVILVKERDDSTRMFETFSVLSFCGMGTLKLFNLYTNRKRWTSIISEVKCLEHEQLHGTLLSYTDSDIEEDYSRQIIAKYTQRHTFISSILLILYSITAIVFIATPFVEYAVTGGSYYPHILPGWAPLDNVGFAGYFVTLIFEIVASVYCVFVHVAFDCTSVGIMIFICGQFSLLRRKTEDIAGSGKDCMPNTKRDSRAHLRIIESHGTHTALCTISKELDTVLRGILGVYFLVATLTVCSVAVRLNSEILSFMQLVSLLQYMAGTLTQLFLFCRYGDAVFHESSFNMGEGPFGAAWWSLCPRMRRQLAMLGAGMMRPRTLHAGPFNKLDLPSFVQIVRAAYSYYAVLGQTSK